MPPSPEQQHAIAVVGMACAYPEANSPEELWENVLAQRRSFRRLPPERLRLENFYSEDRAAEDATYATQAAVIADYEFDRDRFRIAESTYRSTDLAHWLALDVAMRALADAGFDDGKDLPHSETGVILGNTLTGEFSRANIMRLRWHFVRAAAERVWAAAELPIEKRDAFFREYEALYKAPFPPVNSDTLAGGLSNTIAGRICNYLDLHGGCYTVDGACASSLLAVANACASIASGDLEVALAGGVDLSLDPFELIGFAKVGALAGDEMRVFDVRSRGFWPGEGCGFLVLMPLARALAEGRRVYATIRGWGISSDGHGGLTRPELDGQILAIQRAYRRAGFGAESVGYFEGHGTGTNVGDATELRALTTARNGAPTRAAIGSIKANIGHTKAAAGVAGLIKAITAVHRAVLPPTTGCEEPHAELRDERASLRVLREPELWRGQRRAGASAMGFGGINTHVVIEAVDGGTAFQAAGSLDPDTLHLASTTQDAELFLITAECSDSLLAQIEKLHTRAPSLSRGELADLAVFLAGQATEAWNAAAQTAGGTPAPLRFLRAAVVASTSVQLAARLDTLAGWLRAGITARLDTANEIFLGTPSATARIGFLFPGQSSPIYRDGGALARRFPNLVRKIYDQLELPAERVPHDTAVAQPAIAAASAAGLRVLEALGITAEVGVGHSLGEISALRWAGALDEKTLLSIARARGRAMSSVEGTCGAMCAIEADPDEVLAAFADEPVHVVGLNSPRQTVVAGEKQSIDSAIAQALARGFRCAALKVSHAFHTPLMAPAASALETELAHSDFQSVERKLVSTITGSTLAHDDDLRALLCRQLVSPVRFLEALRCAAKTTDLFIEVGPGEILTGLAADSIDVPSIALDASGPSLRGLLAAFGAAFVLGEKVNSAALFADRVTRPFSLERAPRFFANPCEAIAPSGTGILPVVRTGTKLEVSVASNRLEACATKQPADPLAVVREIVARQMKLPAASVQPDSRMLSDLHLNSITVGQLVAEAARALDAPRIADVTRFANATVAQIAAALAELTADPNTRTVGDETPAGLAPWFEAFHVAWVPRPRAARASRIPSGDWQFFGGERDPLRDHLEEALREIGRGVVVVAATPSSQESASGALADRGPGNHDGASSLLLRAARALLSIGGDAHFVLVHHGEGAPAFARTLHRETPGVTTTVVCVPRNHRDAPSWIAAEVRAAAGYTEVHYAADGTRTEPELRWLPRKSHGDRKLPVGKNDVVLVTGGAKGITAECALGLARESGAALGIMGRSDPAKDDEVRESLARLRAGGVRVEYAIADVADRVAVQRAVAQISGALGPITGIIHGAGRNLPRSIAALQERDFAETSAPKLEGLENVLAATPPLRLLVTFGSIIARIGMAGEADYAVANERLARMTERFQNEHPDCRCACFEWSVWSGLGMGQNLGRVEALLQHGVTAIPPDEGARLFCDLLADRELPTSIVVTGRFGTPPTLRFALPDLPRLRFLGNVRIQSPVEIVCDVALSAESDPYVNEHALQGQRLFPAVVALEAMAQVAMALVGEHSPPVFENARFSRPLVVPAKGSATIRIQALRREPDRVDVALLSEETGFAVRHFEVTCSWSSSGTVFQPVDREPGCQPGLPSDGTPPQDNRQDACFIADRLEACPTAAPLLPIQIADDLYEPRLFHTGRFRRVRGYRALSARECVAVISPPTREDWFGANLSPTRLLGDLAGRDAALHAIQACVPHRRVLPIGLARMRIAPAQPPGARIVFANERARTADEFEYDVLVKDESGSVLESWEGLRLRAVAPIAAGAPWAAPLLAPFLERELNDLFDDLSIKVALIAGAERKLRSSAAFAAMGVSEVAHRLDGKPEAENAHVSAAHCGDLTLAVRSDSRIACDLEAIAPATKWTNLFTKAQHRLAETIVGETAEDFATAATRVWVATECLKKAGIAIAPTLPLMLDSGCETRDAGWLGFRAGSARVLTCRAAVRGANAPLVCAICVPSVESTYSVPSLPSAPPAAPKIFEYRHVVTFEDSNVVGNVYFVNHLSWQGRCREMFLRTHAPEAIRQLDAAGLSLATSSVACEFFEELFPFDEVVIRMTLRELTTSTAALVFDYLRQRGDTLTLIARGQHTVAVKRKAGIPPTSAPAVFTAELQAALESYLPAP